MFFNANFIPVNVIVFTNKVIVKIIKNTFLNTNSWSDFKSFLESKTKQEKGKAFEELTKYYLQYNPVYKTKLKHVWLQKEVPSSVIKKLNLPSNDQGIDLVAETFEGTYWAIQCKYLQDEDQRLSHRAISTFISLSTGIAKEISHCLVCTTVDDYAKIYKGKENIGFINSDEWRKLDKDFFDWLRNKLSGKEKKLNPFKPKPHQEKALKDAKQYFLKENNSRGKLVFPCGAGKSLTGYWITRELKPKSIIVAVPSLSLVKQTLEVYLRESVANNEKVSWLCVCSDEGIGTNDDIAIHTNEIGVPCVTDKNYIAKWIKDNSKNKTIIFTTYQSGKTIAEACKIAKHEFDLGIMDEAHKTVGDKDKLFSHLLFDKNLRIKKRIFMTATERRYAGSSDVVLSMDDLNVYGDTFTQMSFKEAIEIGILSDYRIITLFISNKEVRNLIEKNAFVKPTGKEWDKETEARTLASLIALRKAMTEYPIHHAVTFHSSIKKAEAFEQSQSLFSSAYPQFTPVKSYHVSGSMPTSVRGKIVDEFAQTDKAIITNAKCLTEGVDVPNIDCVLFADPRKSTVDIVQAVGRALRRKEGKEFGYVILPVFTESDDKEEIINSDEFKEILSTIRALASNDERIIEYFRDVSKGIINNKKGSLIQFDIDVQLTERINEKELIDSIQLKTWDKLAKLSWMPFEEARAYVRNIGFANVKEWQDYIKGQTNKLGIPASPNLTYKKDWISWPDFLGTLNLSSKNRNYLTFNEAKIFIHKLNLKSVKEWQEYSKSKKRPQNIPSSPNEVYKKNWVSWSDFLGTKNRSLRNREYLDFNSLKKIVHKIGLTARKEWYAYSKRNSALNYPRNPDVVYKNIGWVSWGDFLGNDYVSTTKREYLNYKEAKVVIKGLKIKSKTEWAKVYKSGIISKNIPLTPDVVYKKKGWQGWGDFLGHGRIADHLKEYATYDEAKNFAKKLRLESFQEWKTYCKSNNIPNNIPIYAHQTYKDKGWVSWGEFLGTGKIAPNKIQYLSFEKAKEFARKLKLQSGKEWFDYCKKGNKPSNLPTYPSQTYEGKGWKGFADFLGYKTFSRTRKEYYPFIEARNYARKLKIKSFNEWTKFCKSGKKNPSVPATPQTYYKNTGWISWGDFLGK